MDQDTQSTAAATPGQTAEHALVERAGGVVSPDEIAKIRLWHLLAQAQQIFRQTIFADTKAATLLALVGLIAARVAITIPEGGFDAYIALVFMVKAAMMSACLVVIMPRYPKPEAWSRLSRREQFSWAALSNPHKEPMDYGALGEEASATDICGSIARANQDAAVILRKKFRVLRIAFQLAIIDVFLTIGVFLSHGGHW